MSTPPPRVSTLRRRLAAAAAALALAGTARAQCNGPDDAFEDNDTCATALPIALPFVQPGLWVHRYDPDLFLVTVPSGRELNVQATFVDANGDVDIVLYELGAPCGDLWTNLRSSRTFTNHERVTWFNDTGAPRQLVVQVELWRGSVPHCNSYDLSITAEVPTGGCHPSVHDDALEPNDTCATAGPLPLGATTGLWVGRNNDDFYRVSVPPQATFDVRIDFVHASGDLELFLYGASGPCGGSSNSGELASSMNEANQERIVWQNTSSAPREVIVHVEIVEWQSCNRYDLTASVGGAGLGTNYCTATPNVTGMRGRLSARGSLSVAQNNLVLEASQLPPGSVAAFICSRERGSVPGARGGVGVLCLGGEIGRFDHPGLPTGSAGRAELQVNLAALPRTGGFVAALAGETWRFQAWYRDQGGSQATSNLTDGLELTFQ